MSYTANQYNYATPPSSSNNLVSDRNNIANVKYFVLSNNVLDGTYYPITGDVGLWSASASDANGVLSSLFVVTVNEAVQVGYIIIAGDVNNYPVDFTVRFYNNGSLVYTLVEEGNTEHRCVVKLPRNVSVTSYEITISKISAPNSAARLYNVYRMRSVDTRDTLVLSDIEYNKTATDYSVFSKHDTAIVSVVEAAENTHRHVYSSDTLRVPCKDVSISDNLLNIHTVMKSPFRRIYGKVYITYTDPITDVDSSVSSSGEAYNSQTSQLLNGAVPSGHKFFTLYDNDLSGNYVVSTPNDHVGWTSDVLSSSNGYFVTPPTVYIAFDSRPLTQFIIQLDEAHSCIIENFTVTFRIADGSSIVKEFTGNTLTTIAVIDELLANVTSVELKILKVSKAYYPANIFAVPTQSEFLYTGYKDDSKLVSIDLLEELTYEDDVEALGGMSANEVTIVLDNSDRAFNANNSGSPIASKLLRNRRIKPYLGAEVSEGTIEWYSLGTYWSYKWDVPYDSLTASVIGFDTIGLLSNTTFSEHTVLRNASLGELIHYVLSDAKRTLTFLEWQIAQELYEVIIPYAWFENGSHAAALQRISKSYPMHIYCDREGRIQAMPQKLKLDYYYDVWSNSTNVIDKTYSSLYTEVPNSIFVTVVHPTEVPNDELVSDSLAFNVADVPTYILNFNRPYVDNIAIDIDKDDGVQYTYNVYSWGIVFAFTGSGTVRSIRCTGTSLDTSSTSVVSRMDQNGIRNNGNIKRDIASEFIQNSSLASYIIDRIFTLSTDDKYDVVVNYRGDISLTINDPIRLLDGIAPDDRYNIKRHQLTWDGALTGIAHLNT